MTGPTKAPAPLTLIVEDKQSLRTMIRHALEAHDYAVVEAEDQEDATAALHRHRPGRRAHRSPPAKRRRFRGASRRPGAQRRDVGHCHDGLWQHRGRRRRDEGWGDGFSRETCRSRPSAAIGVAATNKDLRAAVAARQFREDLFFRLSVFPITVPPLRDRPDDVPILARHFIRRFCPDLKKPALVLAPAAEEALRAYAWPGNVRELQNCIERAVILSDGPEIRAGDVNLSGLGLTTERAVNPWEHADLSGSLAEACGRVQTEVERHKIAQVLRDVGADRGLAADQLKVGYRALLAKLKEHGLG